MELDKRLQEAIVFCTLISMIVSGAYVFYNGISEPNYKNGTYFRTAWIVYGQEQNTIYFEYPYGELSNIIPAFCEVMKRTYFASWINYKIGSKPIRLIAMTRHPGETDLREVFSFVVYGDELRRVASKNSKEYRFAMFKRFWEQGEMTKEVFQVAVADPVSHTISYQPRMWRRDNKTFDDMARTLNCSKMQKIIDNI